MLRTLLAAVLSLPLVCSASHARSIARPEAPTVGTAATLDTASREAGTAPHFYDTAQRSAETFARTISARLDTLLQNQLFDRSQVGVKVYDLTDDREIFAHGARQRLRPASNMKVITAVAALDLLGGDYRLSTTLSVPGIPDDSARIRNIYIRGGMDPLFGRDDLRAIVDALRQNNVRTITGDIVLDVSMKDTATLGWGWCWDDKNRPLTPLVYRRGNRFAEHLLRALSDAGIAVGGFVRRGTAPAGADVWLTRTHTIDQVLRPMMKESDNLCAESLFFQIAARSRRPYAGHREAAAQINTLIRRLRLDPSDYKIADGSGLSLYNYVTPELLCAFLRHAYRNDEIFQHLYAALPVMGRDGTLRSRNRNTTAQDNVHAKTGSVEGVSSLAGYALAANGHVLCFSVINQGVRNMAEARKFQDRLCRALTDGLATPHIRPDELSEPAPAAGNQPASEENGPDVADED